MREFRVFTKVLQCASGYFHDNLTFSTQATAEIRVQTEKSGIIMNQSK